MLNNIGLPGIILILGASGAGLNPVPYLLFAGYMAGSIALGMN
jgi:hypothetical protein